MKRHLRSNIIYKRQSLKAWLQIHHWLSEEMKIIIVNIVEQRWYLKFCKAKVVWQQQWQNIRGGWKDYLQGLKSPWAVVQNDPPPPLSLSLGLSFSAVRRILLILWNIKFVRNLSVLGCVPIIPFGHNEPHSWQHTDNYFSAAPCVHIISCWLSHFSGSLQTFGQVLGEIVTL